MARSKYIYVVLENDSYEHNSWFHSAYTVKHEMISMFVKHPHMMPTIYEVHRHRDGFIIPKETVDITKEIMKTVLEKREKSQ